MVIRFFVIIIVTVAVVAGICAIVLPRDAFTNLVIFRDFFDMALPILAFGALVKYLCSCCPASKCRCGTETCNCGPNCTCCTKVVKTV